MSRSQSKSNELQYAKDVFDNYLFNAFDEEKQLLNIGIGRGEMLSCMKEWGYINYNGVDISKSIVDFCKSLDLNCELTDKTENWLENKKNAFDLITLLDVIEHIQKPNLFNFLKSVKNSLTENGILIIQTPNMQSPDPNLHRYNDITHEIGFNEHSLKQTLISVGFKDIRFFGFETIISNNLISRIQKFLRSLYWLKIRCNRRINCNLNPKILNPVFFVVAKKN